MATSQALAANKAVPILPWRVQTFMQQGLM